MPKYAVAFAATKPALIHQVVEMDSREAALRFFFNTYVGDGYSKDAEGFSYFKEDFADPDSPLGSIIEVGG